MSDNEQLKPCPFCGSEMKILGILLVVMAACVAWGGELRPCPECGISLPAYGRDYVWPSRNGMFFCHIGCAMKWDTEYSSRHATTTTTTCVEDADRDWDSYLYIAEATTARAIIPFTEKSYTFAKPDLTIILDGTNGVHETLVTNVVNITSESCAGCASWGTMDGVGTYYPGHMPDCISGRLLDGEKDVITTITAVKSLTLEWEGQEHTIQHSNVVSCVTQRMHKVTRWEEAE